ncbi:MAG: (Na+)-NQR maturation NqrM, partial [Alcanivorax sp.]|nr:(Na+)-NQR maturation NqrM [Alcanivorax sp.]
MLMTIMAAVIFIGLLFTAMAVGVILSNKPIKGSCGGLATLGMKEGCEICGGDRGK